MMESILGPTNNAVEEAPVRGISIGALFERLRSQGRKAVVPYFTAGYPTLETTLELIRAADRAGANLIEIGVPFSDPLADGPSIQRASEAALRAGVTTDSALWLVERACACVATPLALMTYYNTIYARGCVRFCADAAGAGARCLIIPDLPPEEADELLAAAKSAGMGVTFLAAPTSTPTRLRLIDRRSTDFVYAVTVAGVTGARISVTPETLAYLRSLKRRLHKPFIAGFGVSGVETARALAGEADGVVIGSALMDAVRGARQDLAVKTVERLLSDIRRGLDA